MLQDFHDQMEEEHRMFIACFSTTAGQYVLDILQRQCKDRALAADDPHMTYYNIGQHDVVTWIESKLEVKPSE